MEITDIIRGIILILGAIITGFVIPYIKTKVDAATLQKILQYIDIFVAAAEQLFDRSQLAEKKQYVIDKLAEKNFKVDPAILDAEIEAAVIKLHNELSAGLYSDTETPAVEE